ncbi:hypothetical protein CRM22_003109 [Opisthorchis felineus]|uniref:Uncharacterized protein n=1 Tax=Opisthorchis felineus TaxID=147828 RepID=A0A4S2M942_OPIFE|nr:hypothetical protein CRM22_003109 [Opisthorchis felineus]TGZ70618.1 hypothetical protein CRM22_003109 [Opisthorchis felineus]
MFYPSQAVRGLKLQTQVLRNTLHVSLVTVNVHLTKMIGPPWPDGVIFNYQTEESWFQCPQRIVRYPLIAPSQDETAAHSTKSIFEEKFTVIHAAGDTPVSRLPTLYSPIHTPSYQCLLEQVTRLRPTR